MGGFGERAAPKKKKKTKRPWKKKLVGKQRASKTATRRVLGEENAKNLLKNAVM